MKVLHVIPTLAARTGGPPAAVIESSLALRRIGIECTIATTDLAEAASAPAHRRIAPADMPAGADALDIRMFASQPPRRLAFSPDMFWALASEVTQYDVVHIHSLFLFPQFAASFRARRAAVPYVVSPRGALDPHLRTRGRAIKSISDRLWQRGMLEGAAALHVTSADEARLTADVAPGVRREVVPNGINWASYQTLPDRREFRSRCAIAPEAPLVMYLGRLSHKKGLDVLIDAFVAVRRALPSAHLAICGPDDEGLTMSLLTRARRARVANAMTFAGMLHGRDKLAALAAADVWALPSLTENFGIAVVEAMAAGVPSIVSPHVNIAPQIAAVGAGIVAPRDPGSFATAIARVLADAAHASDLRQRGRDFARRYDWNAVAPQLASMYKRAARDHDLRIAA
jgi:glycosyltransferase involved in cell wall biosynthesis